MANDLIIRGTKEEQELFTQKLRHYEMAVQDLSIRLKDFDTKDVLFRSHIEEASWPYRAQVFDPRTFTALYEKTARIMANKPRGRLVPREGGDSLGAQINNALLDFQWDDNERVDGMPMLAKWSLMDLNARKYGASFALVKWHYQTRLDPFDKKRMLFYDGPNFKPLNNRDCLPNPSYSTIKHWFDHRDYLTLEELSQVNDAARGKPIYKNLDILKDALKKEKGGSTDSRSNNYTSKNLTIKGLTDYLGQDEYHKVIEVVTEYSPERWVTFSPKHGVILRDIPNPYAHGQIPIVMLRYYPIDEDLYGLSEIEPIEKIQKAINALVCQYLDSVNMSLYSPLKVRKLGGSVLMHTLEFGPGAKWMMDDPATDVVAHDQQITGVTEFASTYRFLVGAMQEALGETSAGVSGLDPGESKKTATEINDLAVQRNARDNFNQIFLSEALKKQMSFWLKMNQQFIFSDPREKAKLIKIVGKDALTFFQDQGLDAYALSDEAIELLSTTEGLEDVDPLDVSTPVYPVESMRGFGPKLQMEEQGQAGTLFIEPGDLAGNYDYVPDVQSMQLPNERQLIAAKRQMLEAVQNPVLAQMLAQEGYRIKAKEIMEDFFENIGIKDADKYFAKLEGGMYGAFAGGTVNAQASASIAPNGQLEGMEGSPAAVVNGQAQPGLPGPVQI